MLTTNAAKIAAKMNRRKKSVEHELGVAARTLSLVMVGETKSIIQDKIYNVPIPLTKRADETLPANSPLRKATTKGHSRKVRGKQTRTSKWERSGNLKRSESATADGADVVMRNNAKYAKPRFALGGPNPPNAAGRKAGTQRSQPNTPDAQKSKTVSTQWQSEAVTNKRTLIVKARRDAVLRALTSP